jgi:hypothetical protein
MSTTRDGAVGGSSIVKKRENYLGWDDYFMAVCTIHPRFESVVVSREVPMFDR